MLLFLFPTCSCEMMAESSVRPSAGGVARRRRERRLRSWWRHEQQTVRMALAAATHHSAQQNAAPRGPKTGARAREVEEQVTHAGPRAQKAPPPGVRPGLPPEPGPQRSDRTVRRSAGAFPSLTLVSLAGGDAMDDTSVAFLLKEALQAQAREEQAREKERKRLEAAEEEVKMQVLNARRLAGEPLTREEWVTFARLYRPPQPSSSSSSGLKRKKKKKRRRSRRTRARRWTCSGSLFSCSS